jgi:hypothetical protein
LSAELFTSYFVLVQDPVAVNAIECINREVQLTPEIDTYSLSLVAYVNTLYDAQSPVTATTMRALDERVNIDGKLF